ncbi:Multifunctional cytochrome P450 monooxygenase [Pseudocercospora fuligena]|uniref:Multifunctional cytochrome P450 monooxygenase n=1 Tax=Pseudocercospora fuligena TaxID=685502 RepID=A0A8H6RK63_9PEZI|nr:Multifunctional cytochrome P450 monooxygenase [Pseudocercospora fuligena]
MIAHPIFAAWLSFITALILLAIHHVRRISIKLPPGPTRLPLIDNMLDMPPKGGRNWEHYTKQRDLYGPITSLTALGTTIILLHDFNLAEEFLSKRAVIASDRPRPFFLTEMCGWNRNIGFIPYDRRLRGMRKHIHSLLGTQTALADFNPVQDIETRRFLLRILRKPDQFLNYIKRQSTAMRQTAKGDPIIFIVEKALEQALVAGQPGAWLVDYFPALRHLPDWVPGTGFKRIAKHISETENEFSGRPWAFVKYQMAAGKHDTSFSSKVLERDEKLSEEEEYIAKFAANGLYGGGADTTVASIMAFFLTMTKYPEIQSKAQAEIDSVVEQDRMPELRDRESLPYTEAVIKEIFRWHTVVPEGLPHLTTEDCEFEGYFIPKGSIIIANIWAFAHDPNIYRDPSTFNPSRFLGDKPEMDPRNFIFGFGRRICPGKLLADASVFLTIARALAVFDIKSPVDDDGRPVAPHFDPEPGFVSHPAEFKARITPRSDNHEALIMEVEKTHPFGTGSEEDMEKVTVW